MKREDKARVIEELTEKLKSNSVVLVDYKGINVAQSDRLRARSRESGVEFVVAKNTLAQIAADRADIEDISELLVGPTAIAFSEDPVTGAGGATWCSTRPGRGRSGGGKALEASWKGTTHRSGGGRGSGPARGAGNRPKRHHPEPGDRVEPGS